MNTNIPRIFIQLSQVHARRYNPKIANYKCESLVTVNVQCKILVKSDTNYLLPRTRSIHDPGQVCRYRSFLLFCRYYLLRWNTRSNINTQIDDLCTKDIESLYYRLHFESWHEYMFADWRRYSIDHK